MKITLLALGKLRGGESDWCDEYVKRLKGSVTIKEMSASKSLPPAATQKAEAELLLNAISPRSFVVLLDEHGKDITSTELASHMSKWREQGHDDIVFMIGGADGVTQDVKSRANFTLALGRLTWPHRLVRVMLMEQLYRAQQINSGHPYHRE